MLKIAKNIVSGVTKKIVIVFAAFLVIAIVLSVVNFYKIQNINRHIIEGEKAFKDSIIEETTQALEAHGKKQIRQKAIDVARQIEIYIAAHPRKSISDLQNDAKFREIALQPIGETGYTAVHDNHGVNYFHVNPDFVNVNLVFLKETLPSFWVLFEKSFGGPAEGFYDWQDRERKIIRQKYMYIQPIDIPTADGISLRVATTTYIDEFFLPSRSIRESAEKQAQEIESSLTYLLSIISNQFIIIFGLLILLVFLVETLIYLSVLRPINRLSKIAKKISNGDLQLRADVKSKDEIGELATSFNKMTQKLVKANKGLEEKVKKQTNKLQSVLSVSSHQLRTPLTAIKWFLEMVLKNPEKNLLPQQKQFLVRVLRVNQRMILLVNDLLNLAKIESEDIVIERKPTNVYNIIKEVLTSNIDLIKKRKTKITNKIGKDLVISVDEAKISQIFHNLISNAIKYSKGKVIIDYTREAREIIFFVYDNGIGIPKSEQAQLFQKFFRAENVRKGKIEGTGLGLYIAKIIAEAHGGRIWVKSSEGKGSVFYCSLKIDHVKKTKK